MTDCLRAPTKPLSEDPIALAVFGAESRVVNPELGYHFADITDASEVNGIAKQPLLDAARLLHEQLKAPWVRGSSCAVKDARDALRAALQDIGSVLEQISEYEAYEAKRWEERTSAC